VNGYFSAAQSLHRLLVLPVSKSALADYLGGRGTRQQCAWQRSSRSPANFQVSLKAAASTNGQSGFSVSCIFPSVAIA